MLISDAAPQSIYWDAIPSSLFHQVKHLVPSRHVLRLYICLMNLLYISLADSLQLYTVILYGPERLTDMLNTTDICCSSPLCQILFHIFGTEVKITIPWWLGR